MDHISSICLKNVTIDPKLRFVFNKKNQNVTLTFWNPKIYLNQNGDKLWAICVNTKGGWDPIRPLVLHCSNLCILGYQCINTHWLANYAYITSTTNTSLIVLWTLKQTRPYNKYGIWDQKPKIKIKLSMALLELIDHKSFFIHGIV
jgi:hypothetical protein